MNKIFLASLSMLALASAFTGCKNEEDDIFDASAAQRLTNIAATYTDRLPQAKNGWVMQLYPQNTSTAYQGSGYVVCMKFNTDQSVTVGMNNFLTSNVYKEDTSLWEIISDNGPVLSFNSYNNCLHAFSAPEEMTFPDGNDEDGSQGVGVGGDYEFVIVDSPSDLSYMMLKGKKRATYNVMRPLEDGYTFESYLSDIAAVKSKYFSSSSPAEPLLQLGDSTYAMRLASGPMPGFYPYGGDSITQTTSDPFILTKRGGDYYLRLRDAFKANGYSVQEFKLDTVADKFVSLDNEAIGLTGEDPARVFVSSIASHKWSFGTMSSELDTYYKAMVNGFKSARRTLNRINLETQSSAVVLNVAYRVNGRSGNVFYKYDVETTDKGVRLTYAGGLNDGAETLLNNISGLKEFVNFLSDEYTLKSPTTNFNLKSLQFTSTSNEGKWTVLNYN